MPCKAYAPHLAKFQSGTVLAAFAKDWSFASPNGGHHAGSAACNGETAGLYEPVGAALLWTPDKGLGPDFTPPLKAAWTETYMTLAGVMQAAAATVPPPKPAKKGLMSRMFG